MFISYRQLYWCDWIQESIYTAAYDGTGLATVIYSKDSWIYGISLDLLSNYDYNFFYLQVCK